METRLKTMAFSTLRRLLVLLNNNRLNCTIMRKIIFITLLLISGLHVTAASEYDYDFVANGIYYRINDDNASVVVVRSSDYESLTDIVIPDTVEYNGARLRVTQIRPFAFLACKQLKSAVINAEKILHQSFQGINSLSKVVLGNGVRILDWNAFSGCSNLTDLEIQPGLLEIGDNAFYNCTSLQHLDIPSSVVSILGTSFMYCTGLVTIHVDENNPKYDSRGNCNALIETASNRLMVASKSTVIIPDGIEVIGRSAFYGSTLESITFPNTLKTIENYAFAESNLRELSLPASLRSICPGAFLRCSGLTDVILPNGLQTVDDIAFKNCENLRSITFPGTLTKIMDYVVSVCNNLKCVIFKDGGNELEIGENLFFNSKNIQWISFPNSTKTIGKNALLLSEYTTPTTPTHSTYKLLKTFRMPNSVDSLGSTKLAENTYISEFSRLRAVSGDLDYSTLDLTPKTFTFGLNLSSFGRLSNNSWYADIIALLPSVSNIEDARLSPKSHIYCYSETPPVCNEKTFDISGYNSIIVHVPEGAVDAYKSAPRWSFFLNVVGDAVMPTSLTFSKAVIHMKTGEYISPRVSLLPENANGGTLAFACADANIAAVVDDNKIQALQQGRTTLHCTYGALHATCEIIVDDEDYIEPCDINADGTVDISDVNMSINMMLGKVEQTAAGDVNGDGMVDISDVNAVINAMLGKE